MPDELINTGFDNVVGGLEETIVGEVETGAPYPLFLQTGADFTYEEDEVVASDVGDRGGTTGRRMIAKGGGMSIPALLRADVNDLLHEHPWRDNFGAEFTLVGTSDIGIDPAGTHEDGDAGIVLTAPTGDLATLIASGLGQGLPFYARGFVNAGNNQLMEAKNIYNDGATDVIDVRAVFGAGSALAPFGAPKTLETLVSATLRFGRFIKNRRKGAVGKRTLSILVDRCQLVDRFRTLVGWRANDWVLDVPDEGLVTVTVNGDGNFWTDTDIAPQNGEVIDSHFTDTIPDRQLIVGGEDIELLAITGYPNAANPAPIPILGGDTAVTNFSFNLAGNNEVLSNILGLNGRTVRRGRIEMTGELGYYVSDGAILKELERLGSRENHFKAGLHLGFLDPDGFRIGLNVGRLEWGQTGGGGGGDGAETASLAFGAEAVTPLHRMASYTIWSPFT